MLPCRRRDPILLRLDRRSVRRRQRAWFEPQGPSVRPRREAGPRTRQFYATPLDLADERPRRVALPPIEDVAVIFEPRRPQDAGLSGFGG